MGLVAYYPADKTYQIIRNVRRLLKRKGYNTSKVDVTIDPGYLWSFCEQSSEGDVTITLGRYVLFRQWKDPKAIRMYLLHEFGHAWVYQRWSKFETKDKTRWRRIFGNFSKFTEKEGAHWEHVPFDRTQYVSAYATVSPQEDFAETFMFLLSKNRIDEYPRLKKKFDFIEYLMDKY